jgi:Domain of unknown function (DUF4412)
MLMKRFCPLRTAGAALFLLLLAGIEPVFAQMPGLSGGAGSMNGAMIALFGSNTAFSARAEFIVLNRDQKEMENMPLNYAFSNGKMRMDIDLGQFKSTEVPAQFLSTLRQFGMDQTTVIARPDRKLTWSVYPRAKSYAEIPMSKDEISAQAANYKFDRTPEGRETVDGHDCAKFKITLTNAKGEKTDATIWSATDLRSFPIQMRMAIDADSTMIIKFRDVKLAPPDDRQFEVPGALTKYDSPEALLDAVAKRPTTAAQ